MKISDCEIDPEAVLEALGVEPVRSRGDWSDALCPLHPERHPSFSYHADSGAWVCRHDGSRGDLVALAAALRGCDRREAARWVSDVGRASPETGVDEIVEQLLGGPAPIKNGEVQAWASRYVELPTDRMSEYFFDRGFTTQTMRDFDVRLDEVENCLIWPVRDENMNTLSFIKRRLPGTSGTKYLYPRGFKQVFFPLDRFAGPAAILCEGALDAMWLHQLGRAGGLALLGTGITGAQADWLRASVRYIVLALDGDDAGRRATGQLVQRLAGLDVRVARLPDGRDVQDLAPGEVGEVLEGAAQAIAPREGNRDAYS